MLDEDLVWLFRCLVTHASRDSLSEPGDRPNWNLMSMIVDLDSGAVANVVFVISVCFHTAFPFH